jgi:hypothetical protein
MEASRPGRFGFAVQWRLAPTADPERSPANKMKTLASLLVLVLVLGACSKSPSAKVANKAPRGFPPIHTNVEIFVSNYAVSAHRGVQAHPDVQGLKLDGHSRNTYSCSAKDTGGPDYGAAIEYKGTEAGKDYYLATITAPSGAAGVPAPAEIGYEGREIELWRDSQWRIGIRPQVQSCELDGAANGSQPIRSETNRTSAAAGSRR